MQKSSHYLINLRPFSDKDGSLTVLENGKQIPFRIKRVFYIYGADRNCLRGRHANKVSRFCLISVSGSCDIIVEDGMNKMAYHLNDPNVALFLDRMTWKTMTNFSADCVLLILSDSLYDKNEYIRDYDEFLQLLSKK